MSTLYMHMCAQCAYVHRGRPRVLVSRTCPFDFSQKESLRGLDAQWTAGIPLSLPFLCQCNQCHPGIELRSSCLHSERFTEWAQLSNWINSLRLVRTLEGRIQTACCWLPVCFCCFNSWNQVYVMMKTRNVNIRIMTVLESVSCPTDMPRV